MRLGDGLILFVLSIIVVIWLYSRFQHWALVAKREREEEWSIEPDDEIIVTEAVDLLERFGYEVLTGKKKIPIIMMADGVRITSRMFVDHFAENREGIFVVKVAKDSRPVTLDEEGIRGDLLPYQLLYPDAAGVLYVDTDSQTIHKLQFRIDDHHSG